LGFWATYTQKLGGALKKKEKHDSMSDFEIGDIM